MKFTPLVLVVALLSVASCTYAPRGLSPSERAVSEVARFETDQVTGVGVSRAGRVFVNFPLWHDGHRVHVAELLASGDFTPWPSDSWNTWREGMSVRPDMFVCVQSVHIDDMDRVWVVDTGNPRIGPGFAPGASARLLRFDLASGSLVRTYDLTEAGVAPAGSYVNDVRIDTRAGFAYMTDSSRGGLIVLNLETGTARRVLGEDPRTMAETDFVPIVEGKELRFAGGPMKGQTPKVHSDGIAVDAQRGWVYWQALTGRTLYRVPTRVLMDVASTEQEIAAAVENMGPTVMADGIEIDAAGNVYLSALEHNAVYVRTPKGEVKPLVRSALFPWPDSFAIGPGGSLYFTVAQINRTAWFTEDGSMPTTPYRVFRTTLLGW
jgi:sugar lactone lactonase YvrE